jgi:hypothetical protein
MIKKEGGMFHVYSEGGKPFGKYKSKKAARRRIAQMEMFKSIKGKK